MEVGGRVGATSWIPKLQSYSSRSGATEESGDVLPMVISLKLDSKCSNFRSSGVMIHIAFLKSGWQFAKFNVSSFCLRRYQWYLYLFLVDRNNLFFLAFWINRFLAHATKQIWFLFIFFWKTIFFPQNCNQVLSGRPFKQMFHWYFDMIWNYSQDGVPKSHVILMFVCLQKDAKQRCGATMLYCSHCAGY